MIMLLMKCCLIVYTSGTQVAICGVVVSEAVYFKYVFCLVLIIDCDF